MRLLHWILLCYLACSYLAIPVLDLIKLRNYAGSVSLNTLFFAVALQNGLLGIYRILSLPARAMGLRIGNRAFDAEPQSPIPSNSISRWLIPLSVLMLLLILAGPLAIDRSRVFVKPTSGYTDSWVIEPDAKPLVLLMKDVPTVKLDAGRDFRIEDPTVMPKQKWQGEWPSKDTLGGAYYWIPAIDMQSFGIDKLTSKSILVPDSLLGGVDIADIDTLVLLSNDAVRAPRLLKYKMVRKVLHVTTLSGR